MGVFRYQDLPTRVEWLDTSVPMEVSPHTPKITKTYRNILPNTSFAARQQHTLALPPQNKNRRLPPRLRLRLLRLNPLLHTVRKLSGSVPAARRSSTLTGAGPTRPAAGKHQRRGEIRGESGFGGSPVSHPARVYPARVQNQDSRRVKRIVLPERSGPRVP